MGVINMLKSDKLPIVQLNKGKLTYKANYARAAMVLLSKMM